MHIKITVKIKNNSELHKSDNLSCLYQNDNILIEGSNITHKWKNELNESFFISGYIIGERNSDDKLIPVQNYNFLDDTIEKNIAFGVEKPDLEKIEKSIKQANLANFVETLKNKSQEKIGEEGILLSGGQKQRLAIARSLYLDAQILVLDESTSSLDQKTEGKIFEEFMRLKNSKTLVVISHKMLNYEFFDKIISIKNKKIEVENRKINQV